MNEFYERYIARAESGKSYNAGNIDRPGSSIH